MNTLVSINLLTYNGRRFLDGCIGSVLNQTYDNIEFLIIDNDSADDTAETIQRIVSESAAKFPIRFIRNEKNLGFSAGQNQGIRESSGELILCLNQDIILAPDFIKRAIEFLEDGKNEKIGALQPKLMRLDKNLEKSDIIDTTGFVFFKNRRIVNRGQGIEDEGQYNKTEEVFGADGACPIYLRKALEDAKILNDYFDEDFFMYDEDVDMAWRLRLYGWKTFYVPEILAWHQRGAGEKAVTNYFKIALARRKLNAFAKFHAFRNHRLTQIKNDLWPLILKHLPWISFKEVGAWTYVLFFETYTLKAVRDLFQMTPLMLKKRKIIMANKKVSAEEMGKWFK